METLQKLYLELDQLMPDDCKSERMIALENEIMRIKNEEYNRVRSEFDLVVQSQKRLIDLFRWIDKERRDDLEMRFGTYGIGLLDDAIKATQPEEA